MNEFSDHTPISCSLQCNYLSRVDVSSSEIKFVYNEKHKDMLRAGIIGKLPLFNKISTDLNSLSKDCINQAVSDFTKVVRDVADPLFTKCHINRRRVEFDFNPLHHNKEWFDSDCKEAKCKYVESLQLFNSCKNDVNRLHFCECKGAYKKMVRRKKAIFKRKKFKEIEKLRHSRPKDFWRYFKKDGRKKKVENDISLEQFFDYFSNLEDNILRCNHEEAENFCENHDFNNIDFCEDLDFSISYDEIVNAAKKLKPNKAYGNDCLLNEYFIECIDILAPYLCDIFNAILDSGYFPDQWRDGIIIPLHKKGDKQDVQNYRGITLLSCLSNLFTGILNNRMTTFCNKYSSISDAQFGFKKGHSTVDAIFCLNTIIQHYLNTNQRLYVAFIDLKKCFDSIYRNALCFKLFKVGIQGKVLRIIKNMYDKVRSCVKHCNSFSEFFRSFFEYSVGLRQGEVISPILVSLFLEDLELYLQQDPDSGLHLNDIVLILTLFADDMTLLGNSLQDLQNSLNLLYTYCCDWGLEVNCEKTNVVVFRKRGKLLPDEHWTYNGIEIDVVDSFNYLGTVFNYTGTFASNNEHLVGKALKALNVLLFNCKGLPLSPKTLCQLFDSFVGSVLSYSSEIWGCTKSKELERIHLKFCKRILKVRLNCNSAGVYGELGRYPLYISRYCKVIKYWIKVVNSDNILLNRLYQVALADSLLGCKNWVTLVKTLLDDYGFSEVFTIRDNDFLKSFPGIFKQRVIDCFTQEWFGSIDRSSVLYEYKNFKKSLSYETYLDILPNDLRFFITRFRICAHSLRIQTGRFGRNSIPRNERYCLCCNKNDIEDIYHFVCICPLYDDLRKLYLQKQYYTKPSVVKFNSLISSNDRNCLMKLAKFIKTALDVRHRRLNL